MKYKIVDQFPTLEQLNSDFLCELFSNDEDYNKLDDKIKWFMQASFVAGLTTYMEIQHKIEEETEIDLIVIQENLKEEIGKFWELNAHGLDGYKNSESEQ